MNDLIQVVVVGVSSLALDAAQPMESIFIYGAATLVAKVRVAEGYTQTKTSTDGDEIIVHSETKEETGGAFSQALDSLEAAPKSLALAAELRNLLIRRSKLLLPCTLITDANIQVTYPHSVAYYTI